MKLIKSLLSRDPLLTSCIFLLLLVSFLVLRSIASSVFPNYFVYLFLALSAFIIFSQIDFDILTVFHKQLYVISIILLIVPLIIGQVTRGTVRWIPIGPISLQPSEIVRPFLLIFFSVYLSEKYVDLKRFAKALALLSLPAFLILIQPSLGVTILTALGFLGVLLASTFNKKLLIVFAILAAILSPVVWLGLADYQKGRILDFLTPQSDPFGSGYNSLQAMISVGSGQLWGRGLGEGVQTQLSFLPERHTDFIFASIAEELGFGGAIFLLIVVFLLLFRLAQNVSNAKSIAARGFISGVFLTIFAQVMVHVGMNMGILPITGVPLPLVSAGGSSLLATMISLAIVLSAVKH